jgi:methylmalonyl-CoA/ethylmalonyl-CoA epimerase
MTDSRSPLAKRIDHVGVVVRNIDQSLGFYVDVLGLSMSVDVVLVDGSTRLAYLECGETTLQLVQPLQPGPLAEFLHAHGEGLHHICFAVDDVVAALDVIADDESAGNVYIGGKGCRVSFVTRRPNDVLIELTELQPSTRSPQAARSGS